MLVLLVRDSTNHDPNTREYTSTHDQTRAELGEGLLGRLEYQLEYTAKTNEAQPGVTEMVNGTNRAGTTAFKEIYTQSKKDYPFPIIPQFEGHGL